MANSTCFTCFLSGMSLFSWSLWDATVRNEDCRLMAYSCKPLKECWFHTFYYCVKFLKVGVVHSWISEASTFSVLKTYLPTAILQIILYLWSWTSFFNTWKPRRKWRLFRLLFSKEEYQMWVFQSWHSMRRKKDKGY